MIATTWRDDIIIVICTLNAVPACVIVIIKVIIKWHATLYFNRNLKQLIDKWYEGSLVAAKK